MVTESSKLSENIQGKLQCLEYNIIEMQCTSLPCDVNFFYKIYYTSTHQFDRNFKNFIKQDIF